MFDQIETLKKQYTDKYVVVDENRPELKRFVGLTGKVKTVNMSGRALVEFDAYNNIGWYDIGLDFLKVIDQPLPKVAKVEAKKEAAPAKGAPAADAVAAEKKPAAAPAAGAKKSVADVLAAARAKTGAATPAPAESKPAESKPAEVAAPAPVATAPAPAPAAEAPPATEAPKKKLSVQEMLAAARAKDSKK